MGNTVRLLAMRFTDLRSGTSNDGFMLYDDYQEATDHMYRGVPLDDRELLAAVARDHQTDVTESLLQLATEIGMMCGATGFSPEEVRDIIEDSELDLAKEYPEGLSRLSGVCGGTLCFEGTRIPVWVVARLHCDGDDLEEIRGAYPLLKKDAIAQALAYAEENEEEIRQDELDNQAEDPGDISKHA